MVCSKCGLDKEPYLFTPAEVAAKSPVCRKCKSEQAGHVFGSKSRKFRGYQRYLSHQENIGLCLDSMNKEAKLEEQRKLIAARKDRLRKPHGKEDTPDAR